MTLIATLLADPVQVTRVASALRLHHTLVGARTWEELHTSCDERPISVAIVDPAIPARPDDVADPLRHLRRGHQSLALVAYVTMPPTTALDLFDLGRLGLDGVLIAGGSDDPRGMRSVIEKAEARGLLQQLRGRLQTVSPTVRDAVLMSVSRAGDRMYPESMARLMGIRRSLLAEQLKLAGYPSPKQLIAWGRLMVASRMLTDEARSANMVAAALDYSSASAMRNACQHLLGATPQEIRSRGGAEYVVAAFLARVGSSEGEGELEETS